MSCSKPLPPFVCDSLYYLNRNQLERFSIVCRPMKNFIERYFHSKPYRVFNYLDIRGGSYVLRHNNVNWHPNREDYSVRQFLDGQECSVDESNWYSTYYSFAEMCPYFGPNVRVQSTNLNVARNSNVEHTEEIESIAYLWRNGNIGVGIDHHSRIVAEDFQPILNSPIILQCQVLKMQNAHFSLKDYKVLYSVKVIELYFYLLADNTDLNYWLEFLEEPGVKPIVALRGCRRDIIDTTLYRLKEAFSSAVSPNAFKIVFVQYKEPLTVFQETNKTSNEELELKEALPVEYQKEHLKYYDNYTLERYSI